MAEIEDRITDDMFPLHAARQMDVDEIVFLGEVRSYLETMAEACYQSIGYRRVKYPRIWSLRDLSVITHRDSRP